MSFGNPSGHAVFSVGTFGTIFYLLYQIPKTKVWTRVYWGTTAFSLVLFWIVIPFSRLSSGVHSIDQLLLGMTLGLLCFTSMIFVWGEPLNNHVAKLVEKKLSNRQQWLSISIWASFVVSLLTVSVGLFLILGEYDLDDDRVANIKEACPHEKFKNNKLFERKSISN